jgi:hypothetical protein
MRHFLRILLIIVWVTTVLVAQEESRRIWPEEYTKSESSVKPKVVHSKKPAYKIATPNVVVENVTPETVVGVTIWKLRAAEEGSAATMNGGDSKWTAERVEAGSPLAKGDHVRLSIEAARAGYMYIINRERYEDGSYGAPYLIFPTTRLVGGNNRTSIGRVIEIPSQSDQPPYFTLTPGRADQVAEVISVLITPQPMRSLNISDQPVKFPREQVAEWDQKWGKNVGRLEMANGAGQAWTSAEKEAGIGTRLLKHEDPPPQSVYYNPDAKNGDPAFINIDLQYQKQ